MKVLVFVLLILIPGIQTRAGGIMTTAHNLSVTGSGAVKAASETNLCIFCHTIHRTTGQTPLWSHSLSSVTNYVVYSSSTLKAAVGQPDGSSRLCLSCHDGTVALGMVSSRANPIAMQNGVTTMPAGADNLGTDLSGDHPISFVYDQNLANADNQILNPNTINPALKLDSQHKLQCVTCHDPHNDQFGNFLVMDNTTSALCMACHVEPGWTGSAHSTASSQLASVSTLNAKIATRRNAASPHTANVTGCEICHVSHKAGSKSRLLIQAKEEQICFSCHNGRNQSKDLASVFNKASAHPLLQTSAEHNPMEDPINGPRHTACADCHNPHAVTAQKNTTRMANTSRPVAGVKGMSAAGMLLNPASSEYELCFRCHADSKNREPSLVPRQFSETNKRLQFKLANTSFHPLLGPGRNFNVPSLVSPWSSGSTINCTDCHNNDQGSSVGGNGPDGPHGSAFAPILERRLVLTDNSPESAGNYALCYKCHNRSSILSDQSFRASNMAGQDRGHRFHIVDQRTSCTTCHDSHGVQQQAHLVNFNRNYVTPSSNGRIEYISSGPNRGNCSLTCHGVDHNNTSYPMPSLIRPTPAVIPQRIASGASR
ncbi:MAG TPA: cytochrome c3 family protein [Verrucomicrobiae bacterium]|nr:cytochrome c3 family protein [Verrucomicrobiae bacterium]